ncbi:MAG: class I SAM-dependent methyltransferase [Treponema sp.]|nr:class I SAM-dependent methyltransferase [Treponema sp.]
MAETGAVLLVPACERDRGGGHLSRSLHLMEALEEGGRESYLWIPEGQKEEVFERFKTFFENSPFSRGFHARLLSRTEDLQSRTWDFIILDRFRSSREEGAFWSSLGPLIGIDEGGPSRSSMDFLIDLLPALPQKKAPLQANLNSPALLPLPQRRRPLETENKAGPILKVLISFGAEDRAGLGLKTARALLQPRKGALGLDITLLSSTLDASWARQNLGGVRVRSLIPNLKESLADYDLLITHFGLSAFEAVYARVPVILAAPTGYHQKLALHGGFRSFKAQEGVHLNSTLMKDLEAGRRKIARRFGLEEDQKDKLASFFSTLAVRAPKACPACGARPNRKENTDPVLSRFPEESYRRCRQCGIIYLSRLRPPPIAYNEEYFLDIYKNQYGKTYLEDFPNLIEMGRRRLAIISGLLGYSPPEEDNRARDLKPRVLDIGCAYGPFLCAAAEGGYSPFGMDPVEEAVRHVQEELGFPAWQGFFPTGAKAEEGPFDVVSLWYVIEHFTEPRTILKEIHRILRDGGVLAFSTPSYSGISGRKQLRAFLKSSPPDHWTIFNPRLCKALLGRWGFKVKKIVITGHHPERFPLVGSLLGSGKKGLLYKVMLGISRVFGLGDTFEVYAAKEG